MNQHAKKPRILGLNPWWVLFGVLLVAFVVFVIVANRQDWKWTGFTDNTLWDWLKYLIIPLALAIASCLWFTMSHRQGRQQARSRWRIIWIALLVILLVAFVIVVIGGYRWGWAWTGFAGNKLWDWISLLFLPVTLTGGTLWFTEHQNQVQIRTLLGLIPTAPLPKNPSPHSPSFTTVPPPNTPLPVPQQPGTGLYPQWRPPAVPYASQPKGRRQFSFNISRRAALAYLVGSVVIVGGVATEAWNFLVNKDHTVAPPVSAHIPTIDGYDAAIANGVMLGYNAQHTRVDPYEKAITPVTVPQLEKRWSISVGATIGSAATVANGIVYISSNSTGSNNGDFYAINATKGTEKWHYKGIGSNDFGNAPTVANGVVYQGGPDGYLYALDASTGNVRWRGLIGDRIRIGPSPTLANGMMHGMIYIGSDDGKLYAFNAAGCGSSKLCQSLWSYSTKSDIRSSPAVDKDMVYVGSTDGYLYAIDTITHRLSWKFQTGGAVYSSPAVFNGFVYVGSDDGYLYAITTTGKLAWKYRTGGIVRSSPAVANGVVYVGSWDGKLYALNATTGAFLWSYTTEGSIFSSPTIANGVLFIGSDDNCLYAFDVSTHKQLWSYPTGGKVVSSPVVANGFVYVGSNDGYLYAFGLSEGV
jgi:eukaryotic-like serine/threonine-protein kinase